MPRGKGWQIRMKRVEEGGRLSCWLSLRKRICPAAGAAGSYGGKFHPQGCLYKYLRLKGGNKMKHRFEKLIEPAVCISRVGWNDADVRAGG